MSSTSTPPRNVPIWLAACAVVAAFQLLRKTYQREILLQIGLLNPDAISQPWYIDYAALTRVHLAAGAVFTLLGFLQFLPALRSGARAAHRWVGRLLVVVGGAAAITGIWMNYLFPYGGFLKHAGGYFFGAAVLASVTLGVSAIRRRDVAKHRKWMSRAFAIAIAAGVQRLLMAVYLTATGTMTELVTGVCLWTGAVLALGANEFLMRRKASAAAA